VECSKAPNEDTYPQLSTGMVIYHAIGRPPQRGPLLRVWWSPVSLGVLALLPF